jgi:hypothetical protein
MTARGIDQGVRMKSVTAIFPEPNNLIAAGALVALNRLDRRMWKYKISVLEVYIFINVYTLKMNTEVREGRLIIVFTFCTFGNAASIVRC